MSEKKLQCSRVIENFNSQDVIENLVHKTCESEIVEAFLGQIEYGKDYIIGIEIAQDDWADGFGIKYTYSLKFDELVRCRDCKHRYGCVHLVENDDDMRRCDVSPDYFCAWGERKEDGE